MENRSNKYPWECKSDIKEEDPELQMIEERLKAKLLQTQCHAHFYEKVRRKL